MLMNFQIFINFLAVCQVPGTDEVRSLKIEDVIMWCLVMAIARLRGVDR